MDSHDGNSHDGNSHDSHSHNHGDSRPRERHCDVAIIGGSAAGLAAALQLGRQQRSVIVIDAGEPRNAAASVMHSYLGHEGESPAELTTVGRSEVQSYGGEVLDGRALKVTKLDDTKFRIELIGGHSVVARRVIAATGLVDELPDIEGLAEHWGHDVIHCAFCHGYEVRNLPIVQIISYELGLHSALLFRQLTDDLTVILHRWSGTLPDLVYLRDSGVKVLVDNVRRIRTNDEGRLNGVEMVNGDTLPAQAVVVSTSARVRAEVFESVGLKPERLPGGYGDYLPTGDDGQTPVAGIYAAGNVTDAGHQVINAAADGSRVAAMICFDLAKEDAATFARPSGTSLDWDRRYEGKQIWSGNPNGTLVAEATRLAASRLENASSPGSALDVGAGEGADALWLAEQGWTTTANDISQLALDRMRAEANRRDLDVTHNCADANALNPFGSDQFDLVTAQYASIPRTPDNRGLTNLIDAVATGGTLIVVSHDLEPMRRPIDTTIESRMFDPDAYIRVEDFVAALNKRPDWTIEVHETRVRPQGSATSSHHVNDVVLRASRTK